MLIRTQNKKSIVNLNTATSIDVDSDGSIYVECGTPDMYTKLGTYSTEKKAIKILDMIQNAYEYIMTEKQSYTFEMPQDSEVTDD